MTNDAQCRRTGVLLLCGLRFTLDSGVPTCSQSRFVGDAVILELVDYMHDIFLYQMHCGMSSN